VSARERNYRQTDLDGRVSRRRLVRGVALAGVGAAFLAACRGGGDKQGGGATPGAGTAAAQEQPQPGGVFREATVTQAPHFSPFHPGADPSGINTWRRTMGYYEPLWVYKTVNVPDRLVMRLAESREQPDETTYIVKMKPSVFHNRPPANGRECTAEDRAETVKFLMKPPATGGSFIQGGTDLKSVQAIDKLTLRHETFGPRAFFYENLGGITVPKEMLDEETLKRSIPVGNGPYEYKSHTLNSIEEIKRFDNYYLKPRPWIDEKRLTIMPDSVAVESAFRAGQIDAIDAEHLLNVKQRDSLVKDLGPRIKTQSWPITGLAIIANIHRKPFDDIRVREAMYRAIDVERIINVVWFGDGIRSWYYLPTSTTRNPIDWKRVEPLVGYDPKKAGDLLKAAGVDPNKEFELMVPPENQAWVDAGRLIAEDLTKVGLKTRPNPVVRNIYLQRGGPKPGDFDICMSVFLDYGNLKSKSGFYWDNASLEDPEVDALVEKIVSTIDERARDKLWEEVQLMIARKYWNFMPLIGLNGHAAWYTYVKGLNPEFGSGTYGGWQDDRWLDKKA
jgi:peptide/nickel transport system substrate-binding protein